MSARKHPYFPARALLTLALAGTAAHAAVLGDVRGIVHDASHHPLAAARVEIASTTSGFRVVRTTDSNGFFEDNELPVGEYRIRVQAAGFAPGQQQILLSSGAAPVLHFELSVASAHEEVHVTAVPVAVDRASSTTETTVTRRQIDSYAGANQTNSLRMITEFVPGAYIVHDQLHVRGGHQVTWALDGVPIPNTNIATNVGPQFDPKDMDYLEAQTGGYAADYGDRSYGVFNVAPRTGFERDHQAELVASYGNYHATNDQLSFGDHSERFAWYASANGNRTDYGLEPPVEQNLHNLNAGGGAFTSLVFNKTANDQFRFDGSFRADFYQVPNTPEDQASGVRDREREQDGFGIFSWVHTLSPGSLITVSPFYHFNRAAFVGSPAAVPSATDDRASNYEGGQAAFSAVKGRSNLRAGVYAFAQQDNRLFALGNLQGDENSFRQRVTPVGALEAAYVQEQFKLTNWWAWNGGFRFTHFSGAFGEHASDPRLGTAITLPWLGWVLRASYSRIYQAPPLDTVSGPLLQYAQAQELGFLPLHGERDEQYDIGLVVPYRGWSASFDYFRTGARNYFDHDALGNSDIFFPLTIDHARIRGWEANVKSPLLLGRAHAHLVYSNQQAQGFGGTTGGLTDFSPPEEGGYYLDHDQRNTLATGFDSSLPGRTFAAFDFNYGSGFLDGDGPQHLPAYSTFDLSVGKSFGENTEVRAMATNLTGKRYLLDQSNTFGGTHFADPRMLSVEVRYRFHF